VFSQKELTLHNNNTIQKLLKTRRYTRHDRVVSEISKSESIQIDIV